MYLYGRILWFFPLNIKSFIYLFCFPVGNNDESVVPSDAEFVFIAGRRALHLSDLNSLACCLKIDLRFVPSFSLDDIISSLDFTHTFSHSSRKSIFFGTQPYSYNGGSHLPLSFSDNLFVQEMFIFVSNAFPYLFLNSCLINYYPNSFSTIPFHADDEDCIDYDSFIVTISLGANRNLLFKNKESRCAQKIFCKTELSHGSIVLFSRKSQDYFVHGILPEPDNVSPLPRVSATFRKLSASSQ